MGPGNFTDIFCQNTDKFQKRGVLHPPHAPPLPPPPRSTCPCLQWLLLTVSGFQHATLLKKRFRPICLSVNFAKKFLKNLFTEQLRI